MNSQKALTPREIEELGEFEREWARRAKLAEKKWPRSSDGGATGWKYPSNMFRSVLRDGWRSGANNRFLSKQERRLTR